MEFAGLVAQNISELTATRACGTQPLMCASADCVSLLLRLCFDRSETEFMLNSIKGDIDTEHLGVGALYRALTTLVRENSEAAARVDAELRKRLGSRAHLLENTCMREIARVWNTPR